MEEYQEEHILFGTVTSFTSWEPSAEEAASSAAFHREEEVKKRQERRDQSRKYWQMAQRYLSNYLARDDGDEDE
ncbi:hypothetical protein [Novispirillum itersonii]|uniref:hypothetical protein n=1 Tax=Novispirillum itersonii TaxID=189 RepID=UPI0012DBDF20|nr:hypothetical protein [Novispirillum itersonii]